jgi:hypothetical protein
MKRSSLLSVALAGLLIVPGLFASVPSTHPTQAHERDRARELVRQLGDVSFPVREQAQKQLFDLGLLAKDALLEGARDPDLEIRRRCRDLLPAILEADRQARLAAFVADKEGKKQHDLPGWRRYRTVAGNDLPARQFFVEMIKADNGFLADTDKDYDPTGERSPKEPAAEEKKAGDNAGELCAGMAQTLFQKMYGNRFGGGQVNAAEVAALLLVASDPDVRMPNQTRYMMSNFLYQQSVRAALTGPSSSPFKKILVAWMYRQTDDLASLQQMFHLTTNLDLKEGLDLALKVVREKKVQGVGVASALTVIGKMGSKDHLTVLEPFLSDTTAIGNFALNRDRGTTEVRDVALAMMVHLTGQSHNDYGFIFSRTNPGLKFYPNFLGFTGADQRDRAFARWKEWKAGQKK